MSYCKEQSAYLCQECCLTVKSWLVSCCDEQKFPTSLYIYVEQTRTTIHSLNNNTNNNNIGTLTHTLTHTNSNYLRLDVVLLGRFMSAT